MLFRSLGQWKIGHSRVALTANGALFTSGPVMKDGRQSMLKFDRKTSSWVPVENSVPLAGVYGHVWYAIGADGNAVVIAAGDRGRLLWLALQ